MRKGGGVPDGNLEAVLANLESHPAVLKRCQTVYLKRITERLTLEDIGAQLALHPNTCHKYFKAYQKVADKYLDMPTVTDSLAFAYAELARLFAKRKDCESARDYKDLTVEIRKYQEMSNELAGLTHRAAVTEINIVSQTVNVITAELPALLETLHNKTITKADTDAILVHLANRLDPERGGTIGG